MTEIQYHYICYVDGEQVSSLISDYGAEIDEWIAEKKEQYGSKAKFELIGSRYLE